MAYQYDAVGNILSLANTAAVPANQSWLRGGKTVFAFSYDDLYQLKTATGQWEKPYKAPHQSGTLLGTPPEPVQKFTAES